MFRQFLCP